MKKTIYIILFTCLFSGVLKSNTPDTNITIAENPIWQPSEGRTGMAYTMKRILNQSRYYELLSIPVQKTNITFHYNLYFRVYEYKNDKFTYYSDFEYKLPQNEYVMFFTPRSSATANKIGGFDIWAIESRKHANPRPHFFSFDSECKLIRENVDSLPHHLPKSLVYVPFTVNSDGELLSIHVNYDEQYKEKIVISKYNHEAELISHHPVFDFKIENFPSLKNVYKLHNLSSWSYFRSSDDGNNYLCGKIDYFSQDSLKKLHFHSQHAIFKFDRNHKFQWMKMSQDLFDNDYIVVHDMQIDNSGNPIIYGKLANMEKQNPIRMCQVLKLDKNSGNVLAKSQLFGDDTEGLFPLSITITSKNEYLLNADSWKLVKGKSGYSEKYYLMKLDSNLQLDWKLADFSNDTAETRFYGEFIELKKNHYFISGTDTKDKKYKNKRIFLEILDNDNAVIEIDDDCTYNIYNNNEQIIVDYNSTCSESLSISIVDISGNQVYNRKYGLINRLYEKIDINYFSNGVYIATINNNKRIYSKKIIISK